MSWFTTVFKKTPREEPAARLFFTNTLSGNKELFVSIKPKNVLMYTCGPTVYGPVHLGNLRAYLFSDTLARTLSGADYRVKRVTNITDFGHLVSDGDEGEDKMSKGLRREGLELTLTNMRTMAEKYAEGFIDDLDALNVATEEITFPRASDYIAEQIALITTLEQKGYAYQISDGVYYDTARFSSYGKLGGINLTAQKEGARVQKNSEKRNAADFVLWKSDSKLGWQSPWGLGFPGWHIECSAMSRALLGQEIDIHTGGEDLAPIHHNNEIAQSEAASGRTFVHYWLHNAFLTATGGEKASKSLGNVFYLGDVVAKGFHPLALRYLFLQAHYRTPLSFSWDALAGAQGALERLWKTSRALAEESGRTGAPSPASDHFKISMRDDLATPSALGVLWETVKSEDYTPEEKWGLLEVADAHLGLSILTPPLANPLKSSDVPEKIQTLLAARDAARTKKDFAEADRLRAELESSGYQVDDGPSGTVLTKRTL